MTSRGQPSSRSALRFLARKIRSRSQLIRDVRRLKQAGRRIVFTNGCFDLLHAGHAILLEQAKRLGDVLVVAVNSDRSVRAVKGHGRPIVPQRDRALVLAALASVDLLTIFDEPTPRRLVAGLKPDVLAKGADWDARHIVGRGIVERSGGRVVRLTLLKDRSTSKLLERVQRRVNPSTHATPPRRGGLAQDSAPRALPAGLHSRPRAS